MQLLTAALFVTAKKLKITQISSKGELIIVQYLFKEILLNNTKKLTTVICNNTEESPNVLKETRLEIRIYCMILFI